MHIAPFATEEFFARYEFSTPHMLCASDCETVTVAELLGLAGQSLDALGGLRLNYTESQGHPALRTAVAAAYRSVSPDEVIILGAPEEGIFLAMHALLAPGDHVIVLTPAYDSLRNLAQHVSGSVSPWPIQPTPGGWRLDLDALRALIRPQTRLLVLNFPHNPTGLLPAPDEFEAILAIARRHDLWVFADEMYRGLELNGRHPLPSAADLYPRSLTLAGLSKVHGLPGLRAGWLVVRDADLRARLINWKHYTTICAPAPSEWLAQAALAAGEQLSARNRDLITRNLATAAPFFARRRNLFTWRPPQAGSVALVGLRAGSATEFCMRLARTAGILLLPGPHLGADDRYVRMGFGRGDFAANLARLDAYLESASASP